MPRPPKPRRRTASRSPKANPASFTRLDLDSALLHASPALRRAFELSHEALERRGIPHVIVGGLAVNAYGHHYSTKDVDYLVDATDAFDGSLVLTHKPGVPFEVGGVQIDYVTARPDYPDVVLRAMADVVAAARARPDVVMVVPDWLLVWMKLNAGRSKDVAGIEGLIKAGLDVESVRVALARAGDERVARFFERCVMNAEE